MSDELFGRLLGPGEPELTCDECFGELDRFVELHLVPGKRERFEVCSACRRPEECSVERDCLGMRAHLRGCPACAEDHESLVELVRAELGD